MERNKRKKSVSIIYSSGIIFMLLGFLYLFYTLKTVNDSLEQKKEVLSELTDKININKDSLHFIEEKLKLKQSLLDSIVDQIEASDNQVLQKKIDHEIKATQTLENTLKTRNLVKEYNQIDYIQVNDLKTEQYLKEIKLVELLNEGKYQAYGYDLQKMRANNTVRYFHKNDSTKATILGKKVTEASGIELRVEYVPGFERKVPQNQLEVWLKKE